MSRVMIGVRVKERVLVKVEVKDEEMGGEMLVTFEET
jgi:hypothetical protein